MQNFTKYRLSILKTERTIWVLTMSYKILITSCSFVSSTILCVIYITLSYPLLKLLFKCKAQHRCHLKCPPLNQHWTNSSSFKMVLNHLDILVITFLEEIPFQIKKYWFSLDMNYTKGIWATFSHKYFNHLLQNPSS